MGPAPFGSFPDVQRLTDTNRAQAAEWNRKRRSEEWKASGAGFLRSGTFREVADRGPLSDWSRVSSHARPSYYVRTEQFLEPECAVSVNQFRSFGASRGRSGALAVSCYGLTCRRSRRQARSCASAAQTRRRLLARLGVAYPHLGRSVCIVASCASRLLPVSRSCKYRTFFARPQQSGFPQRRRWRVAHHISQSRGGSGQMR